MATWDNAKDVENAERLEDERHRRAWEEGMTQAEVDAQQRRNEKAVSEEIWRQKVIKWRRDHNAWDVHPSDRTIRMLVDLQETYPNVYPGRPASTKRDE